MPHEWYRLPRASASASCHAKRQSRVEEIVARLLMLAEVAHCPTFFDVINAVYERRRHEPRRQRVEREQDKRRSPSTRHEADVRRLLLCLTPALLTLTSNQ